MTFSARHVGSNVQVFNALTGAPWFNITIFGHPNFQSFFINGNTITLQWAGGVTEIWDLEQRRKLR